MDVKADFQEVKQADGSVLYLTSEGRTLDAAALSYYVGSKIGQSLDKQLSDKRSEMALKNQKLAEANDVLNNLRDTRPKDTDDTANLSGEAKTWFNNNMPETTLPAGKLNQGQWDEIIENIKSRVDEMNATSQTDSIDIDALVKHHDEAYEMTSNLGKAADDTLNTIIRNMSVE